MSALDRLRAAAASRFWSEGARVRTEPMPPIDPSRFRTAIVLTDRGEQEVTVSTFGEINPCKDMRLRKRTEAQMKAAVDQFGVGRFLRWKE